MLKRLNRHVRYNWKVLKLLLKKQWYETRQELILRLIQVSAVLVAILLIVAVLIML